MVLEHLGHHGGPVAIPKDLKYSDLLVTPDHLRAALQPGTRPEAGTQRLRKNEASLTVAEQDAFKEAVTRVIAAGTYAKFVETHAAAAVHRIHTLPLALLPTPASGTFRFLPWHRVFLLKMEDELRRFDPSVTIPYWEWTRRRQVPPWLADFKPNGIRRAPGQPGGLPSRLDIYARLQTKPYPFFTLNLEGWTPQAPAQGTSMAVQSAHNQVHVWVGGDMGAVASAVKDPLFWLHHAETDRLWHVWQVRNPGDHPVLLGADQVMDPYPETYQDAMSSHALGIRYEDETFEL